MQTNKQTNNQNQTKCLILHLKIQVHEQQTYFENKT